MAREIAQECAGETLLARADRTLYWPAQRTLFAADLHLGKGAAFRSQGVAIPPGSSEATLAAVSRALDETGAKRLIILGDLWHARAGRTTQAVELFRAWRCRHQAIEMALVEGNHDRKSGRLPEGIEIEEWPDPYLLHPFTLRHYPEPHADGYVLSGHLHPAVTLDGPGRQAIQLPCFWFGREVAVLPAIGDFTGCAQVLPRAGDGVIAIAQGEVFRLN